MLFQIKINNLKMRDVVNGIGIIKHAFLVLKIGCLIKMDSVLRSVINVNNQMKKDYALAAIKDMIIKTELAYMQRIIMLLQKTQDALNGIGTIKYVLSVQLVGLLIIKVIVLK